VRLAIAGNVIDFGARSDFDLKSTISEVLDKDFRIFHFSRFTNVLYESKTIAWLADNAGEIVFDKLLLETLVRLTSVEKVLFMVKDGPFINDATLEDALYVGMDQLPGVEIVEIGPVPGSDALRETFGGCDMVVSKGQGNYEAMSHRCGQNTFFMLMVKCPLVAEDLGAAIGDIVLLAKEA
jgi:uncharacterized protein with ATP-grasp and redox domains